MNIRIEPKTLFVIISDMNGGVFPYNPCRIALTPTSPGKHILLHFVITNYNVGFCA